MSTTSPAATPASIPPSPAPLAPDFTGLATWLLRILWVPIAFLLWDELCLVLMDYWLLDSMGYGEVFGTNFRAGLTLFVIGLLTSAFIIGPAYALPVSRAFRRVVRHLGLMIGVASGYLLSQQYMTMLLFGGRDFGEVDPIFGRDVSFYVFDLPAIWVIWHALFIGTLFALVSWIVCSWQARRAEALPADTNRLAALVARVSTLGTRVTVGILGVIGAFGWWLARYDILIADNSSSSVFRGATYVDATGLFSTVNGYILSAFLTVGVTALVILATTRMVRSMDRPRGDWWGATRPLAIGIAALLLADLLFKGTVAVRHELAVKPNEPVIQIPYITHHINATRDAFNLGDVETIRFIPHDVGDPLPDLERLLASTTFRNAPLWPGFASYLEELVDIHHADRILRTGGDSLVYGPLLDIFRQEQKLRAYYNFLEVDTTRYMVDGERTMVVSAVREVPLVEPQPWLAWWGQQYLLYTHGYGLIAAYSGEITPQGGPVYLSHGLPVRSRVPILEPAQQRVYYGEGSGSIAYTNVRHVEELDFPTDEGRATNVFPSDVPGGVNIDSLLKRLVLGYKSGQFSEILLSSLIHSETRAHYFRTPLERVARVAPHLFLDKDPYAVTTEDGRIVWMVNGMTWADRYPYAMFQELGDKSDNRGPWSHATKLANYARDAVKITVDAFTGEVTFYLFEEDPIAGTLADIYPTLFKPRDAIPPDIQAHLKYPLQLLHVQFDDLYIVYQQEDPMTFFNMEDMWDDADEVLGPILDGGGTVRFSIEPFSVMVEATGTTFPASSERDQFALAMLFTPEGARNLRAMPLVYQDGEDYGRIISLQVPKGHYVMGPEQADSTIDQEPSIAQQFSWWNRAGLEVIRGHTTALVVDNDLFYVEPIFLSSQQNPLTQLKQVAVVFRGKARMASTLREALAAVLDAHREPGAAGPAPPSGARADVPPKPPAPVAPPAQPDAASPAEPAPPAADAQGMASDDPADEGDAPPEAPDEP